MGERGERRRHARRNADWTLTWSRMDGPPRPGQLIDVSEQGISFRPPHPGQAPSAGDLLNLALSVRDDVVVDVRGRVVHAGDRIGASFLHIAPEDRIILRRFVGGAARL